MKKRFKRADWLSLALSELAAKGAEAVRLDALCAAAGLTKGSFYHHFDDHSTFLSEMAQHWQQTQTLDVLDALEHLPPEDRHAGLTDLALQIDYRLELGIRELARRNFQVATVVAATDAMRLQAMVPLYKERFGIDGQTAGQLAYLEYATFSGIILLHPDIPDASQRALAQMFEDMVQSRFGTGAQNVDLD